MPRLSPSSSSATTTMPADTNIDPAIAPWSDIPPTPPPKSPNRTFGFPTAKPSLSSLVSIRQGNNSNGNSSNNNNGGTGTLLRPRRPSESRSALSVPGNASFTFTSSSSSASTTTTFISSSASSSRLSADDASARTLINSTSSSHSHSSASGTSSALSAGIRKSKSSLNMFAKLRSKASKSHIKGGGGEPPVFSSSPVNVDGEEWGEDGEEKVHPSLRMPAPPLPDAPWLGGGSFGNTSTTTIQPPPGKRERERERFASATLAYNANIAATTTTAATTNTGNNNNNIIGTKKAKKNSTTHRSSNSTDRGRAGGNGEEDPAAQFNLDLDLEKMDGILDPHVVSSSADGSYPSDHSRSASQSSYPVPPPHQQVRPPVHSSDFSDPFAPGSVRWKGAGVGERERERRMVVSPHTVVLPSISTTALNGKPLPHPGAGAGARGVTGAGSPTWEAPQSWAVAPKAGNAGDEEPEEEFSSSEDGDGDGDAVGESHSSGVGRGRAGQGSVGSLGVEVTAKGHGHGHGEQVTPIPPHHVLSHPENYYLHPSSSKHAHNAHPLPPTHLLPPHPHPHAHAHAPTTTTQSKRRKSSSSTTTHRADRVHKNSSSAAGSKPYILRIYRENNSYHVVSIAFNVTVASLTPALNKKLLFGEDRDIEHRLYLKERGRERMLTQTERPADIVRKRLEQAGYDAVDGLELLGGEGLSFLLKFVYKSQLLGTNTQEDLKFENSTSIDLTGRGLLTIPAVVHKHASTIIVLKLSRNPMLEIPLDFIQSCDHIRELKLSNMAMKKVPQSVRYASTLHKLDLSSNRIGDLEDAYLCDLPNLVALQVQNNRIESLPWHFPRMRSLVKLNISNNKFKAFPMVVTQIETLTELDVSFNMISELPEEIGRLRRLKYFTIVGNHISKFPDECLQLESLERLDCRRNQITDLTVVCMLLNIQYIAADHNAMHALDLALGPKLVKLGTSNNDITRLAMVPGPVGLGAVFALTWLDLSYAKLSSLDHLEFSKFPVLKTLKLDHNSFRLIPDSLGDLECLETLSCSDNKLDALPATIGRLKNLVFLDAHNNSLTELPRTLWNCGRLEKINATSNFLGVWHDPPVAEGAEGDEATATTGRKMSAVSVGSSKTLPPLVHSLKKLLLGENRMTDDVIHPLRVFKELRVLNLSFNEIQDLPTSFFRHMTKLQELYLSGNKLTSIPTEDLPQLKHLKTLFLNGNKLQTLPKELGDVKSLTILDVGSNLLKYNINNLEFDWNWNFNVNLKYLNLSGNKRLQIKADPVKVTERRFSKDLAALERQSLAGFSHLRSLRVLGLIDVTITVTGIPDENGDRRVRSSLSTVNGMAYGIADSLGHNEHLTMLDLVQEFQGRAGEAIFAMFGRSQPPDNLPSGASPNVLTKFLHDNFSAQLLRQLDALNPEKGEVIPDAIRRTFLKLNQDLHDVLFTNHRKGSQVSGSLPMIDSAILRSGATGIVAYFKGKTMYVANVGDSLAVVSRQGVAQAVSRKHDPYDRAETERIRAAEGWVSPTGYVNDEVDVSRSFGHYYLLPIINARPDVHVYELNELDEFVIIANRSLWDFVPYQTAVDIARTVARTERPDPTIAAQKLRDFAISYGADGTTMIMVVWVADLFGSPSSSRQPTLDSIDDPQMLQYRTKKKDEIMDRNIARLNEEVPAPTGHIAIVFTDIRNSTHLWDVNPGMRAAQALHNFLLRRQLRFCGGYEVKTEGDAFICSFSNILSAVWWCLTVQNKLLEEPWPLEILECDDGKPIYNVNGQLLARGLSVRMGIHCGSPVCEIDPVTRRMDYFGPMVNRSARINAKAAGGQIMCSTEIIREINACIFETEPETALSRSQPQQAVDAIRRMGVVVVPMGEFKLKGIELPETLSAIYPAGLEGRQELNEDLSEDVSSAEHSRVQFSVGQMKELGVLCLRIEALATGRIFIPLPERKASMQQLPLPPPPPPPKSDDDGESTTTVTLTSPSAPSSVRPVPVIKGDPSLLLPPMNDKSTDIDLMMVLDSLSVRIANALSSPWAGPGAGQKPVVDKNAIIEALMAGGILDDRMVQHISSILRTI